MLNCTYQIIVISTNCWESGIKGYKTFVSCAHINFAVGWDACAQSIEFNLLPHSKSWTIVLQHVKLHTERFALNPKRCIVLQHVKLYTWGKNLCSWPTQVLDATHTLSNAKVFNACAPPNFGAFRAHSLTKSENLRTPHIKTVPTRFQRTTHAKSVLRV